MVWEDPTDKRSKFLDEFVDLLFERIESEAGPLEMREFASRMLAGITTRRAFEKIKQALEKPLPVSVRAELVRALGHFDNNLYWGGEAIDKLRELERSPEPQIQMAAIEALREIAERIQSSGWQR